MDTTEKITHLSLCSGYEGIGLGLRRVFPNLREIAYVEIEAYPIANLVAKMEAGLLDQAPIYTDLKTFPYRKFLGKVSILSGGFPCQGFSQAGKQKGVNDPRHLFPYIAEGIRECKPACVFLENVLGILSCNTNEGEPVLKYVLRTLEEMGYRATAGIFSASEVGAPHQRKRVFILGMANGEDIGRGGRTHPDGDDGARLQEQEAQEQPNFRSETAGRSGDLRAEELANSYSWRGEVQNQGHLTGEQVLKCNGSSWRAWPSRPGAPQYEWEEPRVVADSKSQQGSPSDNGAEPRATCESKQSQPGGGHSGSLRESNRQAEPELGGASNGSTCGVDATANRVDRLRLLGNGVVNQTAAKAFVTLIQRVNNK